jgi:MerR HTH family regulatory protein
MTQQYLLGEVAKILGRRPHQIAYLVTTGQVPEPERRIANKRLFSERDILRLARQLKVTPDWSAVGRDADEPEPIESLALNTPFEVIRSGESGHEVRDGDGTVFCWATDRARALVIAGLLESAVRG